MSAATKIAVAVAAYKHVGEFDPKDVIADAKENTRKVSQADVASMMASIEKHGQLQPVKVFITDKGKPKLVYGFTRLFAIAKHNEKNPDHQLKVRAEIVSAQEAKAAYQMSVVENYQRKNPDPIELAENQRAMLEDFGMSEEEVAGVFGWNGTDGVERLRTSQKLLKLPAATRKLVSTRELPTVAALELIGLSEKEQVSIIKNADRLGTGRIKGESVRKASRAKKTQKGGDPDKAIPVTRSTIVDLFVSLTGPGEDAPVRTLFSKLEAFAQGKVTHATMEKMARSMGGLIKDPKAAPKPETPAISGDTGKKKVKVVKKAVATKTAAPTAAPTPAPIADPAEPEPELVTA